MVFNLRSRLSQANERSTTQQMPAETNRPSRPRAIASTAMPSASPTLASRSPGSRLGAAPENPSGKRRSQGLSRGDGGGDGPTARPMVPLPTGKLKAPARVDHSIRLSPRRFTPAWSRPTTGRPSTCCGRAAERTDRPGPKRPVSNGGGLCLSFVSATPRHRQGKANNKKPLCCSFQSIAGPGRAASTPRRYATGRARSRLQIARRHGAGPLERQASASRPAQPGTAGSQIFGADPARGPATSLFTSDWLGEQRSIAP
jgi:hypothetical protein